jgi:hypothetical protein
MSLQTFDLVDGKINHQGSLQEELGVGIIEKDMGDFRTKGFEEV